MQSDPSAPLTEKEQPRYPEFKIQSKLSLPTHERKTEAEYDVQVSVLPLESVKLRPGRGRGRQTPEQRYIPQSNSSPRGSIILQAVLIDLKIEASNVPERWKRRLRGTQGQTGVDFNIGARTQIYKDGYLEKESEIGQPAFQAASSKEVLKDRGKETYNREQEIPKNKAKTQ